MKVGGSVTYKKNKYDQKYKLVFTIGERVRIFSVVHTIVRQKYDFVNIFIFKISIVFSDVHGCQIDNE